MFIAFSLCLYMRLNGTKTRNSNVFFDNHVLEWGEGETFDVKVVYDQITMFWYENAGNKHVILVQKIKKTSSRLNENEPENKRRQKLDFRSVAYRDNPMKPCRVARQLEAGGFVFGTIRETARGDWRLEDEIGVDLNHQEALDE
ncbi:hypothetical protein E3N88_09185 [Mikania micrantha]|uniref:Uncharacterized protein n=1 Tax=Mikania micrantha TaxID=192012 RepID=A0A5N6LJW9_9ASTR|nr:hypothetical protein E3N88_41714 [Mikania micrantha]KAD6454479.1 hypothetical protein E3N88_09185 [Mikania micrantha]